MIHQFGISTSLSLSLTRSVQLTIQPHIIQSMCPKSYLYTYDFRAIYINVHSDRSDRSGPVLFIFHPEGHVSQQTPPSLRHGMFAPIRSASDTLPACWVSTPWSACLTRCQWCGSSSTRTPILLLTPGSNDTSAGYASSWSGRTRS